jgi:uncharacterized protein YcnI
MTTPPLARACLTAGAAGLLVLAAAGTASAHVSADAPGATRGGYAVVTFRVPNESATATTTGVTVTLPTDNPLKSVRSAPLAGWSAAVVRSTDGTPTAVTWTAGPGTSIGADQFGQFAIDVGPLPDTGSITFNTTQTYSNGSVVAWDEAPNADGSEPEHPAPVLALASATGTTDDAGMAVTAAPSSAPVATSDATARWLGGGGLLLGALGLGLGVGATLRTRRGSA